MGQVLPDKHIKIAPFGIFTYQDQTGGDKLRDVPASCFTAQLCLSQVTVMEATLGLSWGVIASHHNHESHIFLPITQSTD